MHNVKKLLILIMLISFAACNHKSQEKFLGSFSNSLNDTIRKSILPDSIIQKYKAYPLPEKKYKIDSIYVPKQLFHFIDDRKNNYF